MKVKISTILFFLISLSGINAQITKLSDDLTLQKLSEDVFLAVHSFPWPANSLVVTSEKELLFIDTPYNDEASEKLLGWFCADSIKRKIIVINTHFHNDNLGGNNYFINKGAKVYGSDLTVELLKKRGLGNGVLEMLKNQGMEEHYNYFRKIKLSPPNQIFSLQNGLSFQCCNDSVEVYFPGAGHTPDNVVVHLKNRKILFGGCIVKSLASKNMGNLGDADIKAWPASIKNIISKFSDVNLIIPGHGNIGDVKLLHHTLELLNQENQK